MFVWRCKRAIAVLLAVLTTVAVCFFLRVGYVSQFAKYSGVRTYYLDSRSSQSLQKEHLSGLDFLRVRGESVYMDGVGEEIVHEILQHFQGSILWTEEAGGVRSYYGYSPKLATGIVVLGRRVNLHIAVGESGCAVGSPIIFGGL